MKPRTSQTIRDRPVRTPDQLPQRRFVDSSGRRPNAARLFSSLWSGFMVWVKKQVNNFQELVAIKKEFMNKVSNVLKMERKTRQQFEFKWLLW